MGDDPEVAHVRTAIQHMMRCLDGFARGLGLDEATTQQIVEKFAAEMLIRTDEERMIEAHTLMTEAMA